MSWDTFQPNYEASASYARYTTGERWKPDPLEFALILAEIGRCYDFIAIRMDGESVMKAEGPNMAVKNRILTQEHGTFKDALRSIDKVCDTLTEVADRIRNTLGPIKDDLR